MLKAHSRRLTAVLIFLIFTVKMLLFLPQVWFYNTRSSVPLPWSLLLAKLALGTYSWAALTPLVLLVSRRWQIRRHHLWRRLGIHLCFGIAFAIVQTALYHLALAVTMPSSGVAFEEVPRLDGPWSFVFNGILAYVSILAVHQAIIHFQNYQAREFSLQQSQLQILKMQLHPHFLFNTLNTIVQLIHENQEAAEKVVIDLSEMLRISLYQMSEQEVMLKQELEFVGRYVGIMKMRFENQLEVEMNIDPRTLAAYVPAMTLQPLVENSIRHGIIPDERDGHIEIRTRKEDGMLHVSVIDDGCGMEGGGEIALAKGGVGLSNMRERLHLMYGAQHHFELSTSPERGVTINISLPFRESRMESAEVKHATD
jgi:two-component system, LytTR family, sensor kinase